ncbi:PLC-like phosphodiesterase [Annulohypoxylon maeteangense]|uniref:PLC-like phosphodiesterase n=1 Tax=Annulohypoxylon maeteangense TaxID=1927788 RepID=UPI002007EB11|nr:PLC-like phosphodiesterase [Annulohypoxylon maeteangense]KAI0885581.1 PLC-like phosphodiesterase [Annulohypoxylon maeteangense]
MALDPKPSFISQPAPQQPLEEAPPVDEQTPLIKPGKAIMEDGGPAGIPVPRSRNDATTSPGSRRLPQAIAHRGYKVVAPENSMLAFRAAVEVGAHAIETDLHLSKDGVVVLSHDAALKRCFGEDSKVRDHEWRYLSTLRTIRKPEQSMPRLVDLLEYLNQPGVEHVWIMLDIKTHDDATELLRRTAEAIASVPGIRPWSERILPCCWNIEYVKLTKEFLPGFPIAHVGISSVYARALASFMPSLSVSMVRNLLAMPITGWRFIRDMKKSGHPIYTWTVNDESWMEWSIQKELDGVITDDPKLFLEVCNRAAGKEADGRARRPATRPLKIIARDMFDWVRYIPLMALIMTIYFVRYGLPQTQVRKTLGSK